MAQAKNISQRPTTVAAAPALAIMAVVLATILVIGAQLVPNLFPATAPSSPTDAALDAGREWQVRYEQMSGLTARRERHDEAVLQAAREWEIRYQQMSGR